MVTSASQKLFSRGLALLSASTVSFGRDSLSGRRDNRAQFPDRVAQTTRRIPGTRLHSTSPASRATVPASLFFLTANLSRRPQQPDVTPTLPLSGCAGTVFLPDSFSEIPFGATRRAS